MEHVISEFRLIETEDGYRLEVKGDKEAMRKAMAGFRRRRHAFWGLPFPPLGFRGHWHSHRRWDPCECEECECEDEGGEGKKGE